jgi:hypothetical protein
MPVLSYCREDCSTGQSGLVTPGGIRSDLPTWTAFSCANWHRSDRIIESLSSIGCVYSRNCNYALVLVFPSSSFVYNKSVYSVIASQLSSLNFGWMYRTSRAVNSFVFVSGRCILSSPSVIYLGGYCRLS